MINRKVARVIIYEEKIMTSVHCEKKRWEDIVLYGISKWPTDSN